MVHRSKRENMRSIIEGYTSIYGNNSHHQSHVTTVVRNAHERLYKLQVAILLAQPVDRQHALSVSHHKLMVNQLVEREIITDITKPSKLSLKRTAGLQFQLSLLHLNAKTRGDEGNELHKVVRCVESRMLLGAQLGFGPLLGCAVKLRKQSMSILRCTDCPSRC